MDHYPEFKVSERECLREDWYSSRHPSTNSVQKATIQHSVDTGPESRDALAPPQYISYPPPSNQPEHQPQLRHDSVASTLDSTASLKSSPIEVEYARYTDAPPLYSEKQYEGKSDDERSNMRMRDYARELSRMMGRQLIRGLKSEKSDSKAK